jgi:alpha-mannosidase
LSSEQGEEGDYAEFTFVREGRGGSKLRVTYGLSPLHDGLWLRLQAESLARPDPGVLAGLSTLIAPAIEPALYLHDHPYGLSTVDPQGTYVRRYPSAGAAREAGPHWTEPVQAPFTASSLVDVCERAPQGRGLLVVHDGSQAFQREDGGLRALLSMYDPWDEDVFDNVLEAELWFLPHGAWTHTERVRAAMECNLGSPRFEDFVPARGGGDLPASFGALAIDAPNVLATAFYRESARGGEGLARHFCSTDAPVRDPFVLRLVEFDGRPADVVVRLPGPIARAARTDLMGEVLAELEPTTARAPFGPAQMPWSALRLRLGPHEIATLYLDLELGRDSPHGATPARPVQSRRGRKS